jgi:hypothetical protein
LTLLAGVEPRAELLLLIAFSVKDEDTVVVPRLPTYILAVGKKPVVVLFSADNCKFWSEPLFPAS